ncbi:MAG: hypothetical protein KC503_12730 [Myxococcales bacterium]|nr:hypothetical protein [Myxococcales bacterium]
MSDHDPAATPDPSDARACSIATYSRPDSLAVGDVAPSLRLERLDGQGHVALDAVDEGGRPLLLLFGSYT